MNKIIITSLMILTLSGCSFMDLKEDLDKQSTLAKINGVVHIDAHNNSNVAVALVKIHNDYPILSNYMMAEKDGTFSFIVEPGLYKVIAFIDSNNNTKYDTDELIKSSKNLNIKKGQIDIEITIDSIGSKSFLNEVQLIKKNGKKALTKGLLTLGNIVTLDSDTFSEENVKMGLWQPYKFVTTTDFGLFLLEEYDPNKKIVLFIHGINGSPRNFQYIIDSIDHSKYQAFVLYYPSGVSISKVSAYTQKVVKLSQAELKFNKMTIVAHSMGGLTSKKYLNLLSDENNELVDTFISISTPWNGHAAANSGLKYSPLIIPVWRDMATSSDFINVLFKTPLAKSTKHYLLFGYKGSSSTTDGNSDGVVSIKSQLRLDAQRGATLVRGFNENHNSILQSKDVSNLINKILKNNYE